ncbi:hypothetical protein B5X24_HaOG212401 [Helicoverpa armigera]|uniref:Uncharacterized protein n=1 Tax=Helicoverpa armigera TaxID=29058 RepID=A0A2W1BG75_HELAM|nr:hypothetical protein B5X24_HaOG212401 [Helicoverpa armigera]
MYSQIQLKITVSENRLVDFSFNSSLRCLTFLYSYSIHINEPLHHLQTRPEKQHSTLASGPPPPAPIVPRAADGPRPPGWNGQPRRHGSSRFNVHSHNQELVKLPPIKGKHF